MPRVLSILLVLLACLVIALGRVTIRRARRNAAGGMTWRIRRHRAMGWAMLGVGTLLMIVAIAGW